MSDQQEQCNHAPHMLKKLGVGDFPYECSGCGHKFTLLLESAPSITSARIENLRHEIYDLWKSAKSDFGQSHWQTLMRQAIEKKLREAGVRVKQ